MSSMSISDMLIELKWRIRGCEQELEAYGRERMQTFHHFSDAVALDFKITGQKRELAFLTSLQEVLMHVENKK